MRIPSINQTYIPKKMTDAGRRDNLTIRYSSLEESQEVISLRKDEQVGRKFFLRAHVIELL